MSAPYRIAMHTQDGTSVAEVIGDGVLVKDAGGFLSLMMEAHANADRVALHAENIDPAFFNLRSGMAGDILQKLVNYRMKLAIVGDISEHLEKSEALKALVRESNRGRDVRFVATIGDGLRAW